MAWRGQTQESAPARCEIGRLGNTPWAQTSVSALICHPRFVPLKQKPGGAGRTPGFLFWWLARRFRLLLALVHGDHRKLGYGFGQRIGIGITVGVIPGFRHRETRIR